MIDRLRVLSGVRGVRCSAHTFRHTFAVSFLRAGGQVFALKEILGHTSLKMTAKYVSLAEADLASQRRFSPADQIAGHASGRPQTWTKDGGKTSGKPRVKAVKSAVQKCAVQEVEPVSHPNKITQPKITETQVREIKAKLAAPDGRTKIQRRAEIAAAYGISAATVKEIDLGYSWRHIE